MRPPAMAYDRLLIIPDSSYERSMGIKQNSIDPVVAGNAAKITQVVAGNIFYNEESISYTTACIKYKNPLPLEYIFHYRGSMVADHVFCFELLNRRVHTGGKRAVPAALFASGHQAYQNNEEK